MAALIGGAWAVFAADALIVLVMTGSGLAADGTLERDMTLGLAGLAALPLALLLAILLFGTRRRSRVGLSICLALGAVPLILVLLLIAGQHGL